MIAEKSQRIEQLLDYILLLRKRQFGASADIPNKDQISLFDEAELERLVDELDLPIDRNGDEPKAQATADDEPKKPVRCPLPAHFDRIEKVIDPSDEEKAAMGDDWGFIGYDISEQLAVIPENAIRPFVIGRKNFLFSGSPRGATASSTLYSLVATAKANGLEPWAYLNHLI